MNLDNSSSYFRCHPEGRVVRTKRSLWGKACRKAAYTREAIAGRRLRLRLGRLIPSTHLFLVLARSLLCYLTLSLQCIPFTHI